MAPKRKMTPARAAGFKRRGERRKVANALRAKNEGIAWADSKPGRRGPDWEDALTREEILRLRGYDV